MSIGSIVNKKVGVKQIIVGAGSSGAELETWVDAAANGQWVQAIPKQKGVGGFFPPPRPGITMHCSAVQEITGWSGGGAPAAPAQPAQPAECGGGGGGEDSGGGGDSETNCAYNYNYSSKIKYY
jgi:hypothetical protein